ncbi:phosphoribosylaminoimidazole carboxylase [Polaribacter sp. HL-MS24]|uniref:phosphoribosylaminoimidazole carboxylase n=1 Tax=Polaribacter sp. HL-MS24 TaxID=3077735 RepID=UPI002934A5C6|nr:phosphoribosylaminoimidazole carboxylase [Polaribacter sp. HL-MS24]WOC39470.1 phosphoribosylaminoimidazole carboxylase [Polaribacter sp. HL-MS24]
MKKYLFLFVLIIMVSCTDNTRLNSCFQNSISSFTIDLNNPELIGLLTPTGYSEINGGMQGIILYNGATLGFKAFDRKCPNFDCSVPMSFDGLRLKCSCDESEYSILTGQPLSEGKGNCFAREYTISENGSSLRISD